MRGAEVILFWRSKSSGGILLEELAAQIASLRSQHHRILARGARRARGARMPVDISLAIERKVRKGKGWSE